MTVLPLTSPPSLWQRCLQNVLLLDEGVGKGSGFEEAVPLSPFSMFYLFTVFCVACTVGNNVFNGTVWNCTVYIHMLTYIHTYIHRGVSVPGACSMPMRESGSLDTKQDAHVRGNSNPLKVSMHSVSRVLDRQRNRSFDSRSSSENTARRRSTDLQ